MKCSPIIDTDQASLYHYYPSSETYVLESPLFSYTNPQELPAAIKKSGVASCIVDFEEEYQQFYEKALSHNKEAGIANIVRLEDASLVTELDLTQVDALLLPYCDELAEVLRFCQYQKIWVEVFIDLDAQDIGDDVWKELTHSYADTPLHLVSSVNMTALSMRTHLLAKGFKHVYVDAPLASTTYCPACKTPLIERDEHGLVEQSIHAAGQCPHCQHKLNGYFSNEQSTKKSSHKRRNDDDDNDDNDGGRAIETKAF